MTSSTGKGTDMTLYTYTTADQYELPLAVARSAEELARMVGMKPSTVKVYLRPKSKKYKMGRRFHRVEVEDD